MNHGQSGIIFHSKLLGSRVNLKEKEKWKTLPTKLCIRGGKKKENNNVETNVEAD